MTEPSPSVASSRLALLRALTQASPLWTVWKSAESAVRGTGDVDSLAPREEWHAVVDTFAAWAAAHDLGPVIECRHVPHALVLVALDGNEPASLVQLDVAARILHRGGTLASARQFAPLTVVDPRGFRRLRPGAEGLLGLLATGTLLRRVPDASDTERMAALIRDDPEGVAAAARALGSLAGAALRAAAAICAGTWPRWTLLEADLRTVGRLVCDPSTLVAVAVFDLTQRRRCPVLTALRGGRRISGDRSAWLTRVVRGHVLHRAQDERVAPGDATAIPERSR
jgi:hypothetical protein